MAPTPQGLPLRGVWASSATDVWTIGDSGTLLHFDGKTWTRQTTGDLTTLMAIHGSGPDDVWAVGYFGKTMHRTAAGWATVQSGTTRVLYAVWAQAPNDAWAVGDETILHWDGVKWSPVAPPTNGSAGTFHGVWASGPSDVWIAGDFGSFRWNGTKWSQWQLDRRSPLTGRGAKDVWSASYEKLDHFDGTAWSPVTVPFTDFSQYVSMSASPDGDLWTLRMTDAFFEKTKLALLRGGAWTEVSDLLLWAIWARSSTDVWAVGPSGIIDHWGAQGLEPPLSDQRATRDFLGGIAPNDVWTVGATGTVNHFTANGVETGQIPGATSILGFHATADDDLWAVGTSGALFHGDGRTWTPVDVGTKEALFSVWASGPNDVWVAGSKILVHKDATGWKPAMSFVSGIIYSVHGWGPNDVWVAGSGLLLSHWNGTKWSSPDVKAVPASQLSFGDVGGSGPTDVWVGGGQAAYYVNQTKNAIELRPAPQIGSSTYSVSQVRGVAPNDLWMLLGQQMVVHWNGDAFSIVETGVHDKFLSLWTAANGDVWIAGGPRVLRLAAAPH